MPKFDLKKGWESVKSQLIKPQIRSEAFLFFTMAVFAFSMLAATIVNFVSKETTLGFITLGYFIALIALQIVELIIFTKSKYLKLWPFYALTFLISYSCVICYLFLAPLDSLYLFWICIIPIMYFLCFRNRFGLAFSFVLLLTICAIFFIPSIVDLTRSGDVENQWIIKIFFVVYYVAVSIVGLALSFVNTTIIKKLDVVKDNYYQDANTDIVTGLRNQAYFLSYVNKIPQKSKPGDTIGLMFIDIDDFKIYNDKYGHTIGNEVLVQVANRLNQVPHDLIVRWGGDEFAIIERNLTRDEFIAKANFLLKSVEGIHNGVTISIGLAYYTIDENFDFDKVFDEADMQAIRAKGKGKNCIVINN